MKGMRYHSAEVADVDVYIADDRWAMEPKLDGIRCIAVVAAGKVTFYSHHGGTLAHRPVFAPLTAVLLTAPAEVTLDGELIDGTLHVFDLLDFAGESCRQFAYRERRSVLEALFDMWEPNALVRLVENATTPEAKQAMWDEVRACGGEGVVVKRLAAKVSDMHRTRDILKIKLTRTVDAIVIGHGGETDSVVLGLLDGEKVVGIGKCGVLGRATPALGDVIEVRYLHVGAGGRLCQPIYMRPRPDKPLTECHLSQLDGQQANRLSIVR